MVAQGYNNQQAEDQCEASLKAAGDAVAGGLCFLSVPWFFG